MTILHATPWRQAGGDRAVFELADRRPRLPLLLPSYLAPDSHKITFIFIPWVKQK